MSNKSLVITGASRGIGAATALLAATAGYAVVVNYLINGKAADAIRSMGSKVYVVQADISKPKEIERMFDLIDKEVGTIQGLVNNAGILEAQMRFDQMDSTRLTRIMQTNILGTMLCARAAVLRMSTKFGGNGGSIVNLSSIASRTGSPFE